MPLKIVRNDITKMQTEAIVNTANAFPMVGPGCDQAIYEAAGKEALLSYRREHIGTVPEGETFLTPGFGLHTKYIIHAVSPLFVDGDQEEESKLRSCYRNSLRLVKEHHIRSVSFPLIATGGFGYPKEEGMRIAIDEINAFLLQEEVMIYLVVFDQKATEYGRKLSRDLESYIDENYVDEKRREEYYGFRNASVVRRSMPAPMVQMDPAAGTVKESLSLSDVSESIDSDIDELLDFSEIHESKLEERMRHLSDTFSEYLLYLIQDKNMENAEVYKRAIVDKKTFSKIKNNPDYHPQKLTALCLCVGAKLNLDETRDLLARAGYALSPCDKTDIIFSYFIENKIYDMIELDIQLEEHGLPCIIS